MTSIPNKSTDPTTTASATGAPRRDERPPLRRSGDQHRHLLVHGLLSATAERRLFERLADPSISPQEHRRIEAKIARSNMRLVEKIARTYTPPGTLTHEDLFAAGCRGLLRAIEKFDVSLRYRFSTYATRWIRQAINRELEDTSHTIRVPSHMHQKIARARRAQASLAATTGSEPSKKELANELGVDPAEVDFYDVVSRRCVANLSLDAPLLEDGEPLHAILPDPASTGPHGPLPDLLDPAGEHAHVLDEVIDTLPADLAEIIRGRYGLGQPHAKAKTLDELGRDFGVSKERIRQKQLKALDLLRVRLQKALR